ncbi:MAG: addiction module protein [Polyangiaceae bacterium]|nr:addiction module protein [Polyangiaceae bacterium]
MSAHAERLTLEALALPASQRAELAHQLIASLHEGTTVAQAEGMGSAEASRRLGEIERGEVQPISQEELFARVRQRLAG